MITGNRSQFEARCRQRGYTLDEVRPCIVSEDGDQITVDETHPAYPRARPVGPGTELKKLLSYIGIKATPNCSCNHKANIMDYRGADWCEENIDTIVEWLREEADKRKLLFIKSLARLLVKKAIKNSKNHNN